MSKLKIGIIVGSLRKDSSNARLAKALIKLGGEAIEGKFLRIDDLPLFNQDLESAFPEPAKRLKDEILASQALLIVTPEYNRSIPGPLKNAVDWASRPYGASAFKGKPVALAGTSPAPTGTAMAQTALRAVLHHLDTIILPQPEMFIQFKEGLIDETGAVSNEQTKAFFKSFVDKFVAWVETVQVASGQINQKAA